jgi:UDP-N-acetylmuramate dehydrogenase
VVKKKRAFILMIRKNNEPIAPYTYYKIGGVAREVYFPESADDCDGLLRMLAETGTPYYVLGGGSNVLVGDGYWDGAVVMLSAMNWHWPDDVSVTCGAGMASSDIAELALSSGRSGLEFLYLLPGSIGGAVAGNARYDNISASDVLIRLTACHPVQGLRVFQNADVDFAYKKTSLVSEGWIICEVTLGWKAGSAGEIQARMDDIRRKREQSRHFEYPSAGCVFKNDHTRNIQVGRLLDSLGLKGIRVGDAEVADFHANFIVNRGQATARDVMQLIERIEKEVRERKGVELEREIRLVGTFG